MDPAQAWLQQLPNGSAGLVQGDCHWPFTWLVALLMSYFLIALLPLLVVPSASLAQTEIPKAEGHDQCPLGYVNTLGTTCVSPIYYEVAPTNGEACLEGWMNSVLATAKRRKGF